MVKCHLSTLMGMKKLKIVDVAEKTGLHRNTVAALYKERARRVEVAAIVKLCEFFECKVGDLFEYVPQENKNA